MCPALNASVNGAKNVFDLFNVANRSNMFITGKELFFFLSFYDYATSVLTGSFRGLLMVSLAPKKVEDHQYCHCA